MGVVQKRVVRDRDARGIVGIDAVAEVRRPQAHVGGREIVIHQNGSEAQFDEDAGAVVADAYIAGDAGVLPTVVQPDAERRVAATRLPSIRPLRKA